MYEPIKPSRPLLAADLESHLVSYEADPAVRRDAAHECAASVLRAGREGNADLPALLELADTLGLDEMGELWRDSSRGTLPATLWTMYLLRAWCRRSGDDVARLFTHGRPFTEVSAAVAGLPAEPSGDNVVAFADELLRGIFQGDLATSLERAAAFFRVISAARADLPDTGHAEPELGFNALSAAKDLDSAAAAWRTDSLH